ncbi:MAG: type II toxin-antitoxin system RelE/ParE family toxin [Clostridiales bacterium]|nr:type II toxin-antitoxin system RelE/ParE family toxin [Clostridiales bacterium]
MPKKELAKILRDVDLLSEYGYNLGMPHIKKMKGTDDIWELHVKISSKKLSNILFHF